MQVKKYLQNEENLLTTEQLEETMQKIMDQYAGGIGTGYQYNESGLKLADEKITFLQKLCDRLSAKWYHSRNTF